MPGEVVIHRVAGAASGRIDPDPVTTEIVRNALSSAANQMKRALIRTAFSPIIYEVLDFAVAIYDRDVRLLSQAPSVPLFMGTMNFCVEAAVEAVGGEGALEPGDILASGTNHRGLNAFQDGDLVELEIEGLGRLRVNIKDDLKRTWARDTRLEHTEKGLEGVATPQLTGKYAP